MTASHPDFQPAIASELLPCPFCGGPATLGGLPRGIIGQVRCRNDDCFGPRTTAVTKRDSVIQWNTRTPSPAGAREADRDFSKVEIDPNFYFTWPAQSGVQTAEALKALSEMEAWSEALWKNAKRAHRYSDDGLTQDGAGHIADAVARWLKPLRAALQPTPDDDCSCGGGDISGHDTLCPYALSSANRLCSCKASARDGQHMAWCPVVSSADKP